MQGALMWLNQYGCQAVQCEVFLCFLPVLDLTSDSLSTSHDIEVTQGTVFIEQNMRFGLILRQLAILGRL